MTDNKEFDNLSTLHAATTPGEWEERGFGYIFSRESTALAKESGYEGTPIVDTFTWVVGGAQNRTFIVAAKNELPALLARLDEVTAERDALAAVIGKAPHDSGCDIDWGDVCDCWKSAAPSSVLAAHDAKVRAEALRDAADALRYPREGASYQMWASDVGSWLRARADKEESR